MLFERIQNLAGGPINLLHRIAVPSIGTLAVKLLRGKERQMRKGVRQIQKERLRFIALNKLNRLTRVTFCERGLIGRRLNHLCVLNQW